MEVANLMNQAEARCQSAFAEYEQTELFHTRRVLDAFAAEKVSARHFAPTTGYGYDDIGRDTLERLYARLFHAEAAIVRPQIASGTHALSLCLFGLLLPGDELLSASGTPYDTLHGIIGIHDCPPGSLRELGVGYAQAELCPDGSIDLAAVRARITPRTRVVAVQRSCGYAMRRTLLPEDVRPLSELLRTEYPNITLMVDNCYGEFVRRDEPTDYGADVCVGSLIKNMGGGLAPTGGYIAGKRALIERIGYRLTAPGVGLEIGSYAGGYQPFYQGLFMAPHTVCQALKTVTLACAVFEQLGMQVKPTLGDARSDIIQAIRLGTPERVVAFCEGIQMASPVDSFALPEPWAMPGYEHQVVMAAGTFVSGASVELSADAPIREPYAVYMQGGLTYSHGRLGVQRAVERLTETGNLKL